MVCSLLFCFDLVKLISKIVLFLWFMIYEPLDPNETASLFQMIHSITRLDDERCH